MMNILETKGQLKKESGEKAFNYIPVRLQQTVVRSMVREFVDRVFDGSARPLLVHLLNEKGRSPPRNERNCRSCSTRRWNDYLALEPRCLQCLTRGPRRDGSRGHDLAPPQHATRDAAVLAGSHRRRPRPPAAPAMEERSG